MDIYLKNENISKGGLVKYLRCSECEHQTFTLQMYANFGEYRSVIGLTDKPNKTLLITNYTSKEESNWELLEQRMNEIFQSDRFKVLQRERYFANDPDGKNFRFVCPACGAYCNERKEITFDSFVENEGGILVINQFKS